MKFLLLALLSMNAFAASEKHHPFMPENNLHRTPILQGGTEEAEFHELIDRVEENYGAIFNQHNAKLEIIRRWEDDTVNASAEQVGGHWRITLFGGIARRTSLDAFTMVICHEIGHHLGGAILSPYSSWAANEGQSDYFANLSCVRRLWRQQTGRYGENESTLMAISGGETLKAKCDQIWQEQDEQQICYRSIVAAKNLAELLAKGESSPQLNTPENVKVLKTYHKHPNAQCRLDTYIAASLCPIEWNESVIPGKYSKDPSGLAGIIEAKHHACHSFEALSGARPSCWFKEPEEPNVIYKHTLKNINIEEGQKNLATSIYVKNFTHFHVHAQGHKFELYVGFNQIPDESQYHCRSKKVAMPRYCFLKIPSGSELAHIVLKGKKSPSLVRLHIDMKGKGKFCRNYGGGHGESFACYDGLACRTIIEAEDVNLEDTWCIDY